MHLPHQMQDLRLRHPIPVIFQSARCLRHTRGAAIEGSKTRNHASIIYGAATSDRNLSGAAAATKQPLQLTKHAVAPPLGGHPGPLNLGFLCNLGGCQRIGEEDASDLIADSNLVLGHNALWPNVGSHHTGVRNVSAPTLRPQAGAFPASCELLSQLTALPCPGKANGDMGQRCARESQSKNASINGRSRSDSRGGRGMFGDRAVLQALCLADDALLISNEHEQLRSGLGAATNRQQLEYKPHGVDTQHTHTHETSNHRVNATIGRHKVRAHVCRPNSKQPITTEDAITNTNTPTSTPAHPPPTPTHAHMHIHTHTHTHPTPTPAPTPTSAHPHIRTSAPIPKPISTPTPTPTRTRTPRPRPTCTCTRTHTPTRTPTSMPTQRTHPLTFSLRSAWARRKMGPGQPAPGPAHGGPGPAPPSPLRTNAMRQSPARPAPYAPVAPTEALATLGRFMSPPCVRKTPPGTWHGVVWATVPPSLAQPSARRRGRCNSAPMRPAAISQATPCQLRAHTPCLRRGRTPRRGPRAARGRRNGHGPSQMRNAEAQGAGRRRRPRRGQPQPAGAGRTPPAS